MSDKKNWIIYECWQSSYEKCDGSYVNSVERDIFLGTVNATEEEIKTLLEGKWNPECMDDEYGVRYRRYEAIEIDIKTIDDLRSALIKCGNDIR